MRWIRQAGMVLVAVAGLYALAAAIHQSGGGSHGHASCGGARTPLASARYLDDLVLTAAQGCQSAPRGMCTNTGVATCTGCIDVHAAIPLAYRPAI